jgi:prepilin-type processing-associated H-X9-DG protein
MAGSNELRPRARTFTLTELVVIVTLVALLVLLIAPGPVYRQPARLTTCTDNLGRISQAVALCFTENNGYGPTWDDGETSQGHIAFMLTWTDLLYDAGYLPHLRNEVCPADSRPDFAEERRGRWWRFYFVERMGVHDPMQYGTRTSYALNSHMSYNFTEDKFEDASRQVYAMDGWWSWIANVNAAWALYEQVTGEPPPDPEDWPHWEGTMHGWRHGVNLSANVLYLDGHVALLTPIVPDDPNGLLTDTVDTMQTFTWLPGERNIRFDWDPYDGEVEEYLGRVPYWTDPEEGTYKYVDLARMPIDFPEELSCAWRTVNDAWIRLPNEPHDRR